MTYYRILPVAFALMACQLFAPGLSLLANTWSSRAWTGDASSNLIAENTVWAYHFGTSDTATVNGVSVPGITTQLAIPIARFELPQSTESPLVFSTDTNNLTAIGGNGSAVMAGGYVLPTSSSSVYRLRGLEVGVEYVATFYGMGIDADGVRNVRFAQSGSSVSLMVDENAYGENNGIRVDHAFTATTSTRLLSLIAQEAGKNWAFVGIALRRKIQPSIGTISDQSVYENATTAQIPLTLNGENPNALAYTITSDNPALVPADAYALGSNGSGGGHFLLITPTANQNGSAVITVQVSDGVATASSSFTLTVNPVNSPPNFSLIGGPPITSAGDVWVDRGAYGYGFNSITSSPDGARLTVLGSNVEGYALLNSTDFGASWSIKPINLSSRPKLNKLASSADGVKLATVAFGEGIFTSTDAGTTWTKRASPLYWSDLTSSADGTKLAAAVSGTEDAQGNPKPARLYTSSNSGVTWTARGPTGFWQCIASSADGTTLVAGDTISETVSAQPYEGRIYISTNSGATWAARGPDIGWRLLPRHRMAPSSLLVLSRVRFTLP